MSAIRVLITGELQAAGRVLLDSIQKVPPLSESRSVVGTLLSVDHRRRRLVLKNKAGRQLQVSYLPQTTFVRLGRRSQPQQLRYGDLLWVDRSAGGSSSISATRVEVVHAREGRAPERQRATVTNRLRLTVLIVAAVAAALGIWAGAWLWSAAS